MTLTDNGLQQIRMQNTMLCKKKNNKKAKFTKKKVAKQ